MERDTGGRYIDVDPIWRGRQVRHAGCGMKCGIRTG